MPMVVFTRKSLFTVFLHENGFWLGRNIGTDALENSLLKRVDVLVLLFVMYISIIRQENLPCIRVRLYNTRGESWYYRGAQQLYRYIFHFEYQSILRRSYWLYLG